MTEPVLMLLWKSTGLLVAGGMAALLCRRSSAAVRHHLWLATLGALLILPAGLLMKDVAPEGWTIRIATHAAIVGDAAPAPNSGAWLVALWSAGAAIMLLRLAFSAWRCVRLVNRAPVATTFASITVRLTETSTAAAWSFGRGTILLPRCAEHWPPDQLGAALRHESAHLERNDSWALLLSELACAVYWFHPLVWFAAHRLRVEQEHAADDHVLQGGLAAPDYAGHLLNIATAQRAPGLLAGTGTRSMLGARIKAILDIERNRTVLNRRMIFASIAAVLLVGLPLAAMQAEKKTYSIHDAGITPPQLLNKTDPGYTKEAKDAKVQGAVVLSIIIDTDGSVSGVTVKKSLDAGLDDNAVKAVQTWRFQPATKGGEPVAAKADITINFKLK